MKVGVKSPQIITIQTSQTAGAVGELAVPRMPLPATRRFLTRAFRGFVLRASGEPEPLRE